MLSIPITYYSALLQALLAAWLIQRRGDVRTIVFIAISACMVMLVGVRWSFSNQYGWFAVALISSMQAPVAWLCFYRPAMPGYARSLPSKLSKLAPALATALTLALLLAGVKYWHWVEELLVALYMGYGVALLGLGRSNHAQFDAVRFSQVPEVRQAAVLAGCLLIFNGVLEGAIGLDYWWYQGRHAPLLVGFAHIVLLPCLTYGIFCAGRVLSQVSELQPDSLLAREDTSRAAVPDASAELVTAASVDDAAVLARLTELVRAQELFRDPDLSLIKLARRMGMPARELSAVVNLQCDKNIAQWINAFRIAAACEQLVRSDASVTMIMLECGFFTKSNFNREFRRHTGLSPSVYRQQMRGASCA
jgi:AraC-like DNA-binding protein